MLLLSDAKTVLVGPRLFRVNHDHTQFTRGSRERFITHQAIDLRFGADIDVGELRSGEVDVSSVLETALVD
jgi:hypothetical protein